MPKINVDWSMLEHCWREIRDSGMFTEGKYVRLFEQEISDWCGMEAVAFNSAGTGLYSMLRMSEVVHDVPSHTPIAIQNNTFYATGAMARECHREIVLVDCNKYDFSMSARDIPANKTLGVVILTHVGGGLSQDYTRIAEICRKRGIVFFEDAAHALGVGSAGHTAGSLSDGAVFSVYPTKAIPVGEGGVVVTRNSVFAARLREFRNYGKYKDEAGVLRHRSSGFNFRMDEWTAAIAYLQMRRRGEICERRNEAASRLNKIIPACIDHRNQETNWYKYPVLRRDAERLGLKKFTGKIYQRTDQLVAALGLKDQGAFPGSDWIADNHVCLPLDEGLYDNMSDDDILAYLRS